MIIGLYGIYGLYNFGCEAILRGSEKLIHMIDKNIDIIYFSYNYDYDVNILRNVNLKVIKIEPNSNLLLRILNKIGSIFNTEKRIMLIDYKKIINSVDELWSIGGDMYTIPISAMTNGKYSYYNHLIDFCDRTYKKGKKLILFGASVGPFGAYKKAVNYYQQALSHYDAIYCREYESIKYLKNIGISKSYFLPDPAFLITSSKKIKTKKYIGVNFSPVSFDQINGKHSPKDIHMIANLLEKIIDKFNADIMMLPHVLSKEERDNDLNFLIEIKNKMEKTYRDRVQMGYYEQGYLGIKESIVQCKLVISARMHCAINAITECIPTIFLSYSQKSVGLCDYIYGNQKWVINLKYISDLLLPKIAEMLTSEEEITKFLQNRQLEYTNIIDGAIPMIKKEVMI